jgi:Family of unknown function (DUF6152)
MRVAGARSIAVAVALLGSSHAAHGHHSVLAFDGSRPTTIAGVVTHLRWQNPHAQLAVEVRRDGATERWMIESESPRVLERLGWSEHSVAVGDAVTVAGARAKDGSTAMRCAEIRHDDGRTLRCFAVERR